MGTNAKGRGGQPIIWRRKLPENCMENEENWTELEGSVRLKFYYVSRSAAVQLYMHMSVLLGMY